MIAIRRLSPGDVDLARRVMLAFEPARTPLPDDTHLVATLADARTHIIVALDGHEPVGVARAHELPRLDGPQPKLFLYSLDVADSHRRQGIASRLIEALLRLGRSRNCLNLWVITTKRTPLPCGSTPPPARTDRPDDVVFVWDMTNGPL